MRLAPVGALLLALSSAGQLFAQDTPPPGEWSVTPKTRLRLTWDYSHDERTDATKEGRQFRREARAVKALLSCEKGFEKKGSFVLKLETVTWTVDTEDFTVTLKKGPGDEEPKVNTKIKDPNAEGAASQEAEVMEEYVLAEYRLLVRPGRKTLQVKSHNGWAGGATASSLFNRCYVHSDLPDKLKSTQRWIDEREADFLPLYSQPGNIDEFPKVKLKLQLGDGVASAKGGGKVSYKGLTPFNWKYAGKSSIKRSFTCSASNHLIESSEEAKSQVKRVDQTEPGKSNGNLTIKQTLKLGPPQ
jgi:hypothetical protein